MAKTNLTLKIDSQLLKKIKILAAKENTSVSALMTALLEEKFNKQSEYERAKERALARLKEGFDLGGRPLSRNEIYKA